MPIFSRFVESSFESLLLDIQSKNENRPADKLGSFGRFVVPRCAKCSAE